LNRDLALSQKIEDLLVSRNLRGMKDAQTALEPGYYAHAAALIAHRIDIDKTLGIEKKSSILIGTGFPVSETFETDGPVGAIVLYETLEYLGARPILVCGAPLSDALRDKYRVHEISVSDLKHSEQETREALAILNPALVISIECPGLSSDGGYFNMRGEDISSRCACFDYFMTLSACQTIAIGDGGNEIGMGNISEVISKFDITPAETCCDVLLIADVSNWAVYGIITLLSQWNKKDLLVCIKHSEILEFISGKGGVDGVTREKTLTEDGLPAVESEKLIIALRQLIGFY
jgi:hypothetical protein